MPGIRAESLRYLAGSLHGVYWCGLMAPLPCRFFFSNPTLHGRKKPSRGCQAAFADCECASLEFVRDPSSGVLLLTPWVVQVFLRLRPMTEVKLALVWKRGKRVSHEETAGPRARNPGKRVSHRVSRPACPDGARLGEESRERPPDR